MLTHGGSLVASSKPTTGRGLRRPVVVETGWATGTNALQSDACSRAGSRVMRLPGRRGRAARTVAMPETRPMQAAKIKIAQDHYE
jgi:hypothetical protein